MAVAVKRWLFAFFLTLMFIIAYRSSSEANADLTSQAIPYPGYNRPYTSKWRSLAIKHPVKKLEHLPKGKPIDIPRIQHEFKEETVEARQTRQKRLQEVKDNFEHAWKGYKDHAWLKDEVAPLTGGYKDAFGGWAATLVDSLDTLWIMGFKKEFNEAVDAANKIDFNNATDDTLNVFETTIRYLGGFLSAYDLSGRKELIGKALELGDMLYAAFDTENRLPITRWRWKEALAGNEQTPSSGAIVAEIGSLSLEFTRLSQLSGDHKYYDAVQRVMDVFKNQQMKTRLPGLWPLIVDPKAGDFTLHTDFTLSAMADSLYEYLPKEYMLLGGQRPEYQDMYEKAMKVANEKIFYYFRNPENLPLMMSGTQTHGMLIPEGQHLACFTGGMVGIGAKIFKRDDELETARALTDGCIWAYESSQSGIMPETFNLVPCESKDKCWWDRAEWHRLVLNKHAHFEGYSIDQLTSKERLPQGFTAIEDRRYQLRPEAIESVFIMYRITGDPVLQDKGWRMFKSITDHTKTPIAFAGLDDVTEEHPLQVDKMESFWTAETLKYFYLLFSEPNVISLDDYVFNTEAHPLKRPGKK